MYIVINDILFTNGIADDLKSGLKQKFGLDIFQITHYTPGLY